ncbi:MAG: hypothetical protein AB1792_06190 [Candidatus Zixiibacteriota bacterium]
MKDTPRPEQELRRSGLAFFGRITAAVSHDLNNVLSTVGELSGLLQDFIQDGRQGSRIPPEKLERVAGSLAAQVQRGAEIVRHLNRFAHSADDPTRTVDLAGQLQAVAQLARSFAARRQILLQTQSDFEAISLRTDPFLFQQAVFLCIDAALLSGERGDTIAISGRGHDADAEVIVTARSITSSEEVDARLSLLTLIATELGGTIAHRRDEADGHHLILAIPRE